MAVTVAEEWLNSCSGCEISILNTGDALLDLLPELNFVHIPVLIDHKYFGQTGEKDVMEIPEAVVGIVSGSVRNDEHKHVLEEMRKKTKILIALGSCAAYGGVPSQANMFTNEDIFEKVFRGCPSTDSAPDPDHPNVPKWLDNCKALDEVVKVDITIPGCPPHPELIADAITALLKGETSWSLPERSVCDTCPVIREKKSAGGPVKRCFENLEFNPEEGLDKMRCINEQGFLCLGTVTLAGCAGTAGVPRCVQARTPCRGCFGPIRKGARPMVDMMGAMTSIGLDPKTVVDRRAIMNRYIGGHGNLRPLPARPTRP
ncbi:MAG: methyl viologen-reducing hydrogenase [Deltaproteobacteria bacterium]|uniref:NADH-quinone oxidoreductase subunit B family protein n=1 Tax=Desulfobacula sp. TaxID=2593537 RepID=UPI001983E824|nr:methyl viologen-reducing hydrogenase [Candidatus Desulfobacula maris]MBL6995037.1 methyl viologen-reducing hydrogenase [Desulfobacula sp.]